ncbi:hypothetical protein SAMD00019534_122890 [Acytostelium subglobosum LB1]|uniref:hypothetical protein n=1 Tax=Acytostelium subglobosum LB1 TaxID=1410327 RepID=UPI000644D8C0|nr:hypothetical protein SAMD00019534_122890 [Acytostelium subglobosum LB1]GAM29113.1 hypothetical protein SAMD00019534_122890 [Acytostelium subglobosum LB1]|eukprot:XP_012747958.1 hypothetical protein SAMD00019534_122890 [Acytostelium subglobosum LB1]
MSYGTNNISLIKMVPFKDVIVYGRVEYDHQVTLYARFVIKHVFQVLPLTSEDASVRSGNIYFIEKTNEASYEANLLNRVNETVKTRGLTEPYTSYSHFDGKWMYRLLFSTKEPFKALLQAKIINDTIVGTAIYVNIAEPPSECPPLVEGFCVKGYVRVYDRRANRCIHYDGCTKSGPCVDDIPICVPGYDLVSIPSRPNGCNMYYCDPS